MENHQNIDFKKINEFFLYFLSNNKILIIPFNLYLNFSFPQANIRRFR